MSYYFCVSFRFILVSEFSGFDILIYDIIIISITIFIWDLYNLIALKCHLSSFHPNSKVLPEIINAISWEIFFFFALQTLKIIILPKSTGCNSKLDILQVMNIHFLYMYM